MKNVVIIGAGGQSQAVLEALETKKNINIIGYLDNNKDLHGTEISGYKVLGNIDNLSGLVNDKLVNAAIIAVGDSKVRKKYSIMIEELNLESVNAIHDKSIISTRARVGKGVFIGPGVVIGPYVEIGDYTIININSVIPHYNKIGKFVNIAPNVSMGGGCIIGEYSFIGIGVSIKQYTNVDENTIVGAGAVVIQNIPSNSIYAGVPAKYIRNN